MTDHPKSLEQRARELAEQIQLWIQRADYIPVLIDKTAQAHLSSVIAALLADVQREAQLADCKAICWWCNEGFPVSEINDVVTANGKPYWHKDEGGTYHQCDAAAIRALAEAPAPPPAGENTTDISSKLNSTILPGRETTILICPVCKRQAEAGEYVGITGCSKCNPWKFFSSAPPTGKEDRR